MRLVPDPRSDDADREAAWRRLLWLGALSWAGCLVAVVIVVVVDSTGWSWPLLWWGVALGVIGFLLNTVLFRLAPRLRRDGQQRTTVPSQRRMYQASYLATGLLLGCIAALLQAAWVDVVMTIYCVLVWIGSLVIVGIAARRRARA